MDKKAERLYFLANDLANRTLRFFETKREGEGDRATNQFMANLQELAAGEFQHDYCEARVLKSTDLRFDFYFPEESTVVEIALSLRNPNSEYERDIFKCLLALEEGLSIKRLLFVSKPGASKRQNSPGQLAISDFVRRKFGLEVEVREINKMPDRG